MMARDFCVVSGANLGDGLAEASQLVLEDVYRIRKDSVATRIAICPDRNGENFTISRDTVVGTPGASLYLDSCATFMNGCGETLDAIILVEVLQGRICGTYVLPLSAFDPDLEYALVHIDTDTVLDRFSSVSCVSFTRGTHVMLADGEQTLIETLRPGDLVMTRDHGPQPIKWIGQQTVRAEGTFAPIVIRKGVLHNSNDLILGPNHRLFIYQRNDIAQVGRPEITVQAKLLINGDSIVQSSGGFVDYFQLLFEDHQIIYVEGIAAESMLVDSRSRPTLPPDVQNSLNKKQQARRNLPAIDLSHQKFAEQDLVDLLRRASD